MNVAKRKVWTQVIHLRAKAEYGKFIRLLVSPWSLTCMHKVAIMYRKVERDVCGCESQEFRFLSFFAPWRRPSGSLQPKKE